MDNGMDRYIGRCLKNWTAKYSPPLDGRTRLLRNVSRPPYTRISHPFSEKIATFLNRYSMFGETSFGETRFACDQFYYPRQRQISGSISQSLILTFHLAANHRLAN